MARGSGSGGGGRGFSGGGSSRGFSGGRSLGGSSSRSSGSSYRPRSSGSSYHSSHHHYYHSGPAYYGGPGYYGRPRRTTLSDVLITMLVLLIVFAIAFTSLLGGGAGITKSTVDREPLKIGHLVTAEYVVDNTGEFVASRSKMESGMKYFFKETGVQPTIYIDDDINGDYNPTDNTVEQYMNSIYDDMFKDEGHLLVFYLFNRNGDDKVWALAGNEAEMVIDNEARDILLDYFASYYTYDSLDNSEYVSKAFESTADRIMQVTKSPIVTIVVVVGAVLIVFMGIKFWKAKKKQKNLEAEQTERIINTPVEKIGEVDDKLEDLKDKYDDK